MGRGSNPGCGLILRLVAPMARRVIRSQRFAVKHPERSSVSVATMVNIQDVDRLPVIVDAVPDAVLTPSRSVLSFERRAEWCTNAVRAVRQHPVDELQARHCHRLR
jgi:hypothetical protein